MNDLVIVGCGGHGRELFAAVAAINADSPTWNVLGFVDDAPTHTDRVEQLGSRVLGDLTWLEEHPAPFALGIGNAVARRVIAARLESVGAPPATIVHPGAHLGPQVHLADGVVIYDRCTLTTNVTIGRHAHLNVACAVQHDSIIGEFSQLSPSVFVNGDCTVGRDVFAGTAAVVTRGCTVGDEARLGAGSIVLDDVAPGATVVGVPARPRPS